MYNFYSSLHAVHNPYPFSASHETDDIFYDINCDYPGIIKTGYQTYSFSALMSVVEKSDMLAVIPLRLAKIYLRENKLNIVLLPLPDEMNVKSKPMYITYNTQTNKSNDLGNVANLIISSFKKN